MPPFSPLHLLFFILALAFLLAIIQVGVLTIAFDKLGLSRHSAFVLLMASFMGSLVNVPLFKMNANPGAKMPVPYYLKSLLRLPEIPFTGKTLVTINLGGGLIPITFSAYLFSHTQIDSLIVIVSIALMTAVAYFFSRPVHGIGIGMPILIAPLAAAAIGLLLGGENSAPLAYICGTLGVLIGADFLRLKDIKNMGTPIASIGGAGTFDGIFLTGIIAALLA